MPETTTSNTREEREAQERTRYREQQASIVLGLRTILEEDEQLLGFARGRIAGGWRGKLAVGPEAFFAPYVNIGLTERRLFLQHIHPEDGKPSEIPPHLFSIEEVASISFSDIETFGQNKEGRLTIRQNDDQYFRIRLAGGKNTEDAQSFVEVFNSLTKSRRDSKPSPTQRACEFCKETFDRDYKFCPYCGLKQMGFQTEAAPPPAYTPPPTPRTPEPPPAPTTQTFTFSPSETPAKPTPPTPPTEPPSFGPSGAFGLAAFAPPPPAPPVVNVEIPVPPAPPEIPTIAPIPPLEAGDERGAVDPEIPGDASITEEAAPIPVTAEETEVTAPMPTTTEDMPEEVAGETPAPTPPDSASEGHEPANEFEAFPASEAQSVPPPSENKSTEGWL